MELSSISCDRFKRRKRNVLKKIQASKLALLVAKVFLLIMFFLLGVIVGKSNLLSTRSILIEDISHQGVTRLFYPTNKELVCQNNAENLNVLVLQNLFKGNSFSAMAFRGNDDVERGAIGYGNPTADYPFRNSTYLEASYFDGSKHNTPPSSLKFVQTGYMGGSYGNRLRQEFTGDGKINFYNVDNRTKDVIIDSVAGRLDVKQIRLSQRHAPLHPSNGDLYYDVSTNKFRGYADGKWVDLH